MNSSIRARGAGFLPITRTALSPRPTPMSKRPSDCFAREPNIDAATDQSRVLGLVTQGPKRILVVCSINMAMAMKLSRHRMWLSYIQQ